MEDRGFDIIPCSPANPGLITAAKAEFQVPLQKSKKESPELSCVAIKEFGPNCRELFSYGVEVSLVLRYHASLANTLELATNEFITSRCGPYQDAVKDEAIMSTVRNNPQLPPYRAGPGKVLLFKPIDHGLSEEVGFLRYFEGSHRKSKPIGEMPERGISVELDHILAMDGDLVIRWPKTGGAIFMLQGIIKKSPK